LTTFAALFVPAAMREAVSDEAWLAAMLDAERALANAEATLGLISAESASEIAAACVPEHFDIERLADEGRATGNPAEPLVRALRKAVGPGAADSVHRGATSQDIVDTAAMLVARGALALLIADLAGVAAGCARLAETHRESPMIGRTLLQPAVPTTFGLKAAGWLVAVLDAGDRLVAIREKRLAAQLGGAAGTLSALGDDGPEVLRLYAAELGLPEPALPWHAARGRVSELGQGLAEAASVLAKIGLDVALLGQAELGEVHEPAGKGASSTMPHKRNPVGSVLAGACARQARAAAALLTESVVGELERPVGAWQAEWGALSAALGSAGGAAAAIGETLDGLQVDVARMRANLDGQRAAVMSEALLGTLAARLGRKAASDLIASKSVEELQAAPPEEFAPGEIEAALDPMAYLGSARLFTDRALARYREAL
jgi:3-carboxy-cis,cis-muconate cycloisomerase